MRLSRPRAAAENSLDARVRAGQGRGTEIPDHAELWDAETAERYDAEDAGMFAPRCWSRRWHSSRTQAAGGPALELAIGTGRVGVALRRRGVPVSGIELSEPMVAQLRAKAGEHELPVVVGDMATARARGVRAGLPRLQHDHRTCSPRTRRWPASPTPPAISPRRAFVVECFVPAAATAAARPGRLPVRRDGRATWGVDTVDVATQLLTSHHFSRQPDGTYRRGESRHRYAWPAEMDLMARLAGLTLTERYADWDRSAYTGESERHVSVAGAPLGSLGSPRQLTHS